MRNVTRHKPLLTRKCLRCRDPISNRGKAYCRPCGKVVLSENAKRPRERPGATPEEAAIMLDAADRRAWNFIPPWEQ